MVSRYPKRYPVPQNDEGPAEAEPTKSLIFSRNNGWRCRSRTYDPLITRKLLRPRRLVWRIRRSSGIFSSRPAAALSAK